MVLKKTTQNWAFSGRILEVRFTEVIKHVVNNSSFQSFAPRDLLQLCCFTDSQLLVFLCACVLHGCGTTSTWRQQATELMLQLHLVRPSSCSCGRVRVTHRELSFLFLLFSTGVPFSYHLQTEPKWWKDETYHWPKVSEIDSSCSVDSVEAHRVFAIFVHQHMEKKSRWLLGAGIVAVNCSD